MSTEEGGKTSPLFNGYFPLFNFDGQHLDGGEITFEQEGMIMPGDSFSGEVKMIAEEEWHTDNIYPGADFTIHEKGKIIGTGVVVEIYD